MSDLLMTHLFRQLTLLLDLIYIGEVNVFEDDLMPSCLLPASSRLKGSHQTRPPKWAKSGFSSTQEESIAGPQLTSTPIQGYLWGVPLRYSSRCGWSSPVRSLLKNLEEAAGTTLYVLHRRWNLHPKYICSSSVFIDHIVSWVLYWWGV